MQGHYSSTVTSATTVKEYAQPKPTLTLQCLAGNIQTWDSKQCFVTIIQALQDTTHMLQADWPSTIQRLMGDKTIALITHQRHLDVRKMLLPAFAPKTLLQYIPRITEIAEELCTEWVKGKELKGEHAMKAYTSKVSSKAFCTTAELQQAFPSPQALQ